MELSSSVNVSLRLASSVRQDPDALFTKASQLCEAGPRCLRLASSVRQDPALLHYVHYCPHIHLYIIIRHLPLGLNLLTN